MPACWNADHYGGRLEEAHRGGEDWRQGHVVLRLAPPFAPEPARHPRERCKGRAYRDLHTGWPPSREHSGAHPFRGLPSRRNTSALLYVPDAQEGHRISSWHVLRLHEEPGEAESRVQAALGTGTC